MIDVGLGVAKQLGIGTATLYRRLKGYGLIPYRSSGAGSPQ